MYVVNDIAYADTSEEMMKVSEVKILEDMMMIVKFSSGEKRLFDASLLLKYPVFHLLKNKAIFSNPAIDHGVITWNNGEIDIAPETLYQKSFEYC